MAQIISNDGIDILIPETSGDLTSISGTIPVYGRLVKLYGGTITRDGNGLISSITLNTSPSSTVLTFTRNGDGSVASFTDGTHTWTISRDGNGAVSSWSVA